MNRESNGYTILFATIMVVVVGGLLAFIASSLKPAQLANVKNEKMVNILQSIDPSFKGDEMKKLKRDEVVELFNKHVKQRIVLDLDGNIISDLSSDIEIDPKNMEDAFNLNPRKQYAKISRIIKDCKGDQACVKSKILEAKIYAPMFVCEKNGQPVYVAHFSGKGLWDDIWGYVGIKPSRRINAAVFDHKSETPGLGSKIVEPWFQDQYIDKTMATASDEYKSIKVYKPGSDLDDYSVEGISGATFTGVGVDEMMGRALQATHAYMKKNVAITEDTYVGESVSYGLEANIDNLTGDWISQTDNALKITNSTTTMIGDSLSYNGRNGQVVELTNDLLLIKWADASLVSSYSKKNSLKQ